MMVATRTRTVSGAQSIERAVAVLRAVAASKDNGATLADVVTASELTKGTAHRLLMALAREGLVERDARSRTYFSGEQLYALGILASSRFGLHQLALPSLRRLALKSQDSAFLVLRSGDDVVVVHREEGTYPIRTHVMQVGLRYPLGVGSFGVAMLATLPDDEVEEVLQARRRAIARFENFSPERIRQLIKAARAKGFWVNPGLVYPESHGIAMALCGDDGKAIGALSIGAVASRLQSDRLPLLASLLKTEVATITTQLKRIHRHAQR
jgi:DNA-binding IclR family transcriptional regulator